jgi:hypothetical protein
MFQVVLRIKLRATILSILQNPTADKLTILERRSPLSTMHLSPVSFLSCKREKDVARAEVAKLKFFGQIFRFCCT